MSRVDELPPGRPQNEPRKLVPENKDQQLHFALSIAEHLARTIDEERALRHGIVLDYQKLTEEHAADVARTDNTATQLSNFLTDLEALIPEDCRNTRPDRLASVRAAVGMMAQKLAGGKAAAATAPPGTGAWAWEQMQRGPEVWVCRHELPVSSRYHMKHPGLIENAIGSQFNGVEPKVLEQLWPGATDWELCAAPGSKEAKRAEFYALADSVSDTPLTAPSAKDGPTVEQIDRWFEGVYLNNGARISFDAACRLCWQAAREGMVARSELDAAWQRGRDSREPSEVQTRLAGLADNVLDAIRTELTTAQDELRVCKSVRDTAERRVGELEGELQLLKAGDPTTHECSALRAELERVKAELAAWDIWGGTHSLMGLAPAAARDSIAGDLTELVEANDALGQIENLCGSDEELEPDGVVELVRRTLPIALPLTEAQREELAKVVYPIVYPLESHMRGLHQTSEALRTQVYQAVDAIAPRIARVGLRELSDAEISKATTTLRVERVSHEALAMGGAGRLELMGAPCYTIRGTREFARAILAAAQGGTEPGSDALNKQYQELKQLTTDLGISGQGTFEWHFARIREAFAAQPPRGRKLTDGEEADLAQAAGLCHRYNGERSPGFQRLLSFVESLLAPQELEAPRRHTPFSELFHALWGQAKEKEYDKALWVQAHEMLLAPQDGARVVLGVLELVDIFGWVRQEEPLFSKGGDKLVTQALSASTGDKFEFSVVARRVG